MRNSRIKPHLAIAVVALISSIAFSSDGVRVAIGLHDRDGIRVYDWSTGEKLLADRDYADDV